MHHNPPLIEFITIMAHPPGVFLFFAFFLCVGVREALTCHNKILAGQGDLPIKKKMSAAAGAKDSHFKIKKSSHNPFFKLKEIHMVMSWKFMGQTVCAICKAPLDQPAVEYVCSQTFVFCLLPFLVVLFTSIRAVKASFFERIFVVVVVTLYQYAIILWRIRTNRNFVYFLLRVFLHCPVLNLSAIFF